jgi:hypothetical protein
MSREEMVAVREALDYEQPKEMLVLEARAEVERWEEATWRAEVGIDFLMQALRVGNHHAFAKVLEQRVRAPLAARGEPRDG